MSATHPTRLETRTKESNTCASQGLARKPPWRNEGGGLAGRVGGRVGGRERGRVGGRVGGRERAVGGRISNLAPSPLPHPPPTTHTHTALSFA
ncbi:hypothetical protein MJG53_000040 [Ovis ammon polii x Ovis aries]|nr:hypothetical protein MJG53_000040 [Ovis ammon polii x Ovis aries]